MCTKNYDHMGTPPKNHDKETPETFNICNLPKYFFEGAAKENLLFIKGINVVQLLAQSEGETHCSY